MKKIKLLVTVFILMLSFGIMKNERNETIVEASPVNDTRQFKGAWVSTFTGEAPYSSESQFKSHMSGILDVLEYYGYNAMLFHVRTHNNAFYASDLNPVASWWSTANFAVFDPLTWLIEETHSRGIEFHAWMNPYRVSTTYQRGTMPSVNPQSNSSNLLTNSAGATILNPALPNVRQHIYDTIEEFMEKYPTVEGIHFDDYFYIDGVATNLGAVAKRDNVSLLIKGIKDLLDDFNSQNGTFVQFGISPTGIYRNGNGVVSYDSNGHAITTGSDTRGQEHYASYLFADTVKWAQEGWIDYLVPQVYWARNHNIASFTKILSWWNKVFKNIDVNLYTGIGLYMSELSSAFNWTATTTELRGQLNEIDGYDKVEGYVMYAYKNLKMGYDNTSNQAAKHVNNAYDAHRRRIEILPEVRSMTPVIPGEVKNISNLGGLLSWDAANDGKFYYIYRSSGEVTYSVDEIIGVVGGSNLSYNTGDTSNVYNYGIRALSGTNHLSPIPEEEPLETYTVGYNLNGGSFELDYANRDEMLMEFFNDFYEFLEVSNMSLNDFVHGVGNTTGYDGVYDQDEYFDRLYLRNNKQINPSTGKFINQPEYNKWVPLLDLIDEYVKAVNSNQSLWDSVYEGKVRIKNFMKQYNYNKPTIDPLLNKIPDELHKGVVLIESYNENTQTFELPTPSRVGYEFLGWYNNASFVGVIQTEVTKGSTGDLNFYAKWKEDEVVVIDVEVTFDLGYDGLFLPKETIPFGSKVGKPTNPTRIDCIFLGWYKDNNLYDFNSNVYEDILLVAKWQKEEVTVVFDLNYGGLFLDSVIIEINTKVTQPADPARSGYTFLGWYKDNVLFDFNTNLALDAVIEARWEKIIVIHTVSFNIGYSGGVNPNPQIINEGNKATRPNDPVRSEYVFLGWYKDNYLYDFNSPVNDDLVLTAKWEKENVVVYVTVTFDVGYPGGVNPASVTVIEGEKVNKPSIPARPGHQFIGWFVGEEEFDFNSPVNYSVVLLAKYEEIHLEDIIVMQEGASIRLSTTETKQGLRFYAQVCNCFTNNIKGFYVIYGQTTKEELQTKINNSNGNDFYINGKKVHKKNIPGQNDDNEFSIVLTGIPSLGYLDKITVIPYVVIEGVITLGETKSTRSVADVALNGYNDEGLFADLVSELNDDLYIYKNNNIVKETIYEDEASKLRSEFLKDYNAMFDEDFEQLYATDFFTNASLGAPTGNLNRNRDISNTRIYKFFNDPVYGQRWSWLIDFLLDLDEPHPTRQIGALKGDGTNNVDDGWSNRGILYKGSHLIYSIANFFNGENVVGHYTALDFTNGKNYGKLKQFNNQIVRKELNGDTNYILKNNVIKLEETDLVAPAGFEYKYFDGVNYYEPNTNYVIKAEATIELVLRQLAPESYTVMFYENGEELTNLFTTYNTGDNKPLPTPEKVGYSFVGWYSNPSLTGSKYTNILPTDSGNKTFYAKFEELASHSITYVLNGGIFGDRYETKEQMLDAFLDDFYNYLVDKGVHVSDKTTFKHGVDNTSGFNGEWHSVHQNEIYYSSRPTAVNERYFISSSEYMDKWLPFFDMMETFVININAGQRFYGSRYVGLIRIHQYFVEYGWSGEFDEVYALNIDMMPREFTLPTEYFEDSEVEIPIPIKAGFIFDGWFLDENFSEIIDDPSQITGDVTLYAKWK